MREKGGNERKLAGIMQNLDLFLRYGKLEEEIRGGAG